MPKDQIKTLHVADQLIRYMETEGSTFIRAFSSELKANFPQFKGNVTGFLGKTFPLPQKNVFSRSGKYVTSNAVQITGFDGDVLLKKDEFKIVISHR